MGKHPSRKSGLQPCNIQSVAVRVGSIAMLRGWRRAPSAVADWSGCRVDYVSATEHSRLPVSRLHAPAPLAGSELMRRCLGTEGEGIEGSHAEREQSRADQGERTLQLLLLLLVMVMRLPWQRSSDVIPTRLNHCLGGVRAERVEQVDECAECVGRQWLQPVRRACTHDRCFVTTDSSVFTPSSKVN